MSEFQSMVAILQLFNAKITTTGALMQLVSFDCGHQTGSLHEYFTKVTLAEPIQCLTFAVANTLLPRR
ncbi:hypothetical protein VIBNISO65_250137 [Vibrio nigripulchritudo SO65]|nr:hypothetical protein VIBNIAM115_170039 [Vibrio nigripulchritudo AM115]CCN40766.1 hypothetical protein VIBNIFTn2_1370136 [Vibrio nigripulchritudo FTn2]CCN64425.1 hypothetical protein VIBNIPon4_220027 [Vibrio nigripulchritudo POn4]CCN77466.1 hypothetical protein VIBNISO65_250137 [Vibrio nigripulchritudo SO65]